MGEARPGGETRHTRGRGAVTRAAAFAPALVALLLAGVATPLPAQDTAGPAATTAPPQEARRWLLISQRDFETQHPGMGVSRGFQSLGVTVSAYYYDLRRSWQRGLADPLFAKAYEHALAELRHTYPDLQLDAAREVSLGGLVFRCQRLRHGQEPRSVESRLCLTAVGGKLLKYRISAPRGLTRDLDAEADSCITATLDARYGAPLPWLPLPEN